MNRFNLTLLSAISLLLIGCAGLDQLPTAKYPADSDSNARNFSVSSDVGRIYYSVGKVTGGMYEVELSQISNLYVNSIVVGRVSANETLVFDLKPGAYSFGYSMNAEPPAKLLDVKILGGDIVTLRGDVKMGSTGFGLIGAAINPGGPELLRVDRTVLRQPINPVAPQSCPNTLCVTPLMGASMKAVTPEVIKGADRLLELNELRKKGLITNADYEAKKATILKSM